LNFKNLFSTIFIFSIIAILFTNPFLHYPYDIFQHLIEIDKYFLSNDIPENRKIWHFIWAKIFYFFNIHNNDILFRAKIIHLVQTYIAFFSIYYFSKVVIRNLFQNIDTLALKYLSFWSVIIWFSIFATYSMHYQLIWNLWYSVNYQITLPLFWYITTLTLILILEKISTVKKIFFILQILIISRFILQAHSMEYMYYLMYILTITVVFIDKILYISKKYFYILIPVVVTIIVFAKKYQPENSAIFNYLSFEKLPKLYGLIVTEGEIIVNGFNRSLASINELMYLTYYLAIIISIIFIRDILKTKSNLMNTRVFVFIIITSMFVFIPLFELSGGIFAIITRTNVINRIYYSSSLFVLIPIFVYYVCSLLFKNKILMINIILALIIFFTLLYSKYNNNLGHNYYKNVISIKNSFFERKVGFHLSKKQILTIGDKLKFYESIKKEKKPMYYYARADIAFVIKYIFRKNVYWESRRANPDYIKLYTQCSQKHNKTYNCVLFQVPKGFPEYEPYK